MWAEITGLAAQHARTARLYLLFMAAAGIVAGVGVLDGSSILVVGAMALSPDLLPISAAAVGLVERRWALAGRATLTLIVGLGVAALTAAGATLLLRLFGRIDEGLALADTVLGPSLTDIGPGTVLVALAAGMAGMLAYETAAGSAVGVAISVTTIPAAAYVGCALGSGHRRRRLRRLGGAGDERGLHRGGQHAHAAGAAPFAPTGRRPGDRGRLVTGAARFDRRWSQKTVVQCCRMLTVVHPSAAARSSAASAPPV